MSLPQQLSELHDLVTRGVITQEEFEAAKARVLESGAQQEVPQPAPAHASWPVGPAAPSNAAGPSWPAPSPTSPVAPARSSNVPILLLVGAIAVAGMMALVGIGAWFLTRGSAPALSLTIAEATCFERSASVSYDLVLTNTTDAPLTLGREDRMFATFETGQGKVTLAANYGWHGYGTEPDSMPAMAVTLQPGESTPVDAAWPAERDASASFDLVSGESYRLVEWSIGTDPSALRSVAWDESGAPEACVGA